MDGKTDDVIRMPHRTNVALEFKDSFCIKKDFLKFLLSPEIPVCVHVHNNQK